MIEARGVSFTYPEGTVALNNIDLKISGGELVYVIGASGSGKTSLLKLLMGVEFPTSGSLKVLGQAMLKDQHKKLRQLRTSIGPVFQEFRLIKGRTAMENVMLGMRFLDFSPAELKENAANALARVGLAHKASSRVENLSWGESQRVSIARAVARKPALILADEPTGNLDKENALNILDLLSSFRNSNTAVVITTHATHLIGNDENISIVKLEGGIMNWERRGQER